MERVPLPKTIKTISTKGAHAVFAIEPLYPGYGITVGNALRRVLLSSLPGAAITNVSFAGASHEFSTLPYVKEDVVDIILNLKRVRLQLHGDGPATIRLKVNGAKTVTAGDIEASAEVDVISKDQVIATLTDKAAAFELEMTVEAGRGYVPVEQRETPKNTLGTIAIDAVFTPIRTVNFTTENMRVGQMTNYDRLILDITTDGSIAPQDAVQQAATILRDHFQFVVESGFNDDTETAVVEAAPAVEPVTTDEEVTPKKRSSKTKADEE